MSWVKRTLLGFGILVAAILVLVGGAYALDAPIDATIREKNCMSTDPTVTVVTHLLGVVHTLKMTHDKCGIIQEDNFVRYHLRTGHTIIYSSEGGACVFDSVTLVC